MADSRIIADQIGVSDQDLMKQALMDMRHEMHILSASMAELMTKFGGSENTIKALKEKFEAQSKQKTPQQLSDEILNEFKKQRDKDKEETLAKIKGEFKVFGEKYLSGGVTGARSVASDAFGYFAKDHSAPATQASIEQSLGKSIQSMFGGMSKLIAPKSHVEPKQEEKLLPTFQDFQKTAKENHKELTNKIDNQFKAVNSTVEKLMAKINKGEKLSDTEVKSLAKSLNKELDDNNNKTPSEIEKEKKLRKLDEEKDKIIAEQESKLKILKEKFSGGMTAARSLISDAFGYFAQDHSAPSTQASIEQSLGGGLQKAFGYVGAKIQPRYMKDKKQSGETPLPGFDPSMDNEPMPRTLGEQIKKDTEKAIELISNDMRNEADIDDDNDAAMRRLVRKVDGIDNEADGLAESTEDVDEKVDRLEKYVKYNLVDEIVAKLKGSGLLGEGGEGGGGLFDSLLDLLDLRRGGKGAAGARKGGRLSRAFRKAKLAMRGSKAGRAVSAARRAVSGAKASMGRAVSGATGRVGSAFRSIGSKAAGVAGRAASAIGNVGSSVATNVGKMTSMAPRLMAGLGKVGSVASKAAAFMGPAMAAYGAYTTAFDKDARGKEAMRLSQKGVGGRVADTLGFGNVKENYKDGFWSGTGKTALDVLSAPVQWGKNIGTAGGLLFDTAQANSQKSGVESKNTDRIKNMSGDDYEQSVNQFMKPLPDGKQVSEEVARAAAVSQALRKMSIGPAMMASQSQGSISELGNEITSILSSAAGDLMVDTRTGRINVNKAKSALDKLRSVSGIWSKIKGIVESKEDSKSNLDPDMLAKGDLFYSQLLPQRLGTMEEYINNFMKPKKSAEPKVEAEKKAASPSTALDKSDDAFSRMDKALETGKPIEPPAGYRDPADQLKSNLDNASKTPTSDKTAAQVGDLKSTISDQNSTVLKVLNDIANKLDKTSAKEKPPVQHFTPPDYSMLGIQSLSKGIA
jgi:hypothetical protein